MLESADEESVVDGRRIRDVCSVYFNVGCDVTVSGTSGTVSLLCDSSMGLSAGEEMLW